MQLRWTKRGLVFSAHGQQSWMNSHAQVPTCVVIGDAIRVFFASRPRQDLSLTTFVDLDASDPTRILHLQPDPIMQLGPPGTFDEHGIMPQHAMEWDSRIFLFYAGWSRRASIPYSNWVGLSTSKGKGTTFEKLFDAPILDRQPGDIFSATGLFCMPSGRGWVGWYASGTGWIDSGGGKGLNPLYEIRQCESDDLIRWTRQPTPLLAAKAQHESNTRPAAIQIGDKWLMWFCYRNAFDFRDGAGSYRIGFAWSDDLKTWHRQDEMAGIDVASTGWDSTMLAYPNIVRVKDEYIMFYNGNGFGQTGFGFATASAHDMETFAASLNRPAPSEITTDAQ